jgi:hypothetical protein
MSKGRSASMIPFSNSSNIAISSSLAGLTFISICKLPVFAVDKLITFSADYPMSTPPAAKDMLG